MDNVTNAVDPNAPAESSESRVLSKMSDQSITQIIMALEEEYPTLNRLSKGWKLVGFQKVKNGTEVPIYYYMWPEKSRYSGATLRKLRAERGVGAKERKIAKRKQLRELALTELVEVGQALGLYENNPTPKVSLDKPSESV